MEEILLNFLFDLNNKGLINNHDFEYEKVVRDFVNKDKNKKCECGGNARVALDCTMKPCKFKLKQWEEAKITKL